MLSTPFYHPLRTNGLFQCPPMKTRLSWWYQLESNQRHKDFQSFALPTELWHHLAFCGCKGTINILIEQEKTKYFLLLNVY